MTVIVYVKILSQISSFIWTAWTDQCKFKNRQNLIKYLRPYKVVSVT